MNQFFQLSKIQKEWYLHLYTKISILPAELKAEVNDFVDFILKKRKKENKKKVPKFGCAKGQIQILPDFDEPP